MTRTAEKTAEKGKSHFTFKEFDQILRVQERNKTGMHL